MHVVCLPNLTICHVLISIYFYNVYIDIPFIPHINAHCNCTICSLWTWFPPLVFLTSVSKNLLRTFEMFSLCVFFFQYSISNIFIFFFDNNEFKMFW